MKRQTSLRMVLVALTAALVVPLGYAGIGALEDETLTGCLNVTNDGSFQLTVVEDGKRGNTIRVQGSEEQLTTHAKNHTVKLTGSKAEEGGKPVFKVTKIEHVSGSCEATTE